MTTVGGGICLDPEDRVLFIINDMTIMGNTRFQKYGFLLHKQYPDVLERLQPSHKGFAFYKDWKPHYFGPYSQDLKDDIDANIKKGFIKSVDLGNTTQYMLTLKGRARWREMFSAYSKDMDKIIGKIRHMQTTPLYELLRLIYTNYRDYAVRSKIADKVGA